MKITIITLFPKLHETFFSTSIIGRAIENKALKTQIINLLDFCQPKKRVDIKAVGPGAGMVIKPWIIKEAIEKAEKGFGPGTRIFFTPQGLLLDQTLIKNLFQFTKAKHKKCINTSGKRPSDDIECSENSSGSSCAREHLILICSRYEGPDQRVVQAEGDIELSIGNYVVMGGDLPAQVFLEAFLRLIPGVVGDEKSVSQDSFQECFFDYPSFCQPKEWSGLEIPEILLSGNHEKITQWRNQTAAKNSVLRNFDWVRSEKSILKDQNKILARESIPKHFVCVMHSQVCVEGGVGTTSVTSIDIQDIARSCATFGVEQLFIVTPMIDQAFIANQFLDFWKTTDGQKLNPSRYQAIKDVLVIQTIEKVLEEIYLKTGKSPLILVTSAKNSNSDKLLSFNQQEKVWKENKPVLIVFGTGNGLSDRILDMSDFILAPISGLVKYNHLTVRAAAGIILDRWLGLNIKKRDDFSDLNGNI